MAWIVIAVWIVGIPCYRRVTSPPRLSEVNPLVWGKTQEQVNQKWRACSYVWPLDLIASILVWVPRHLP